MKIRGASPSGQSVVETALSLPLILVLLGGGFWFYRDLSLSSSSESAAHAHMLRSGRRQGGIAPVLSRTIHPEDNVARIEEGNEPLVGEVPLFHGLSGRTTATSKVSLGTEPVGAFLEMPSHAISAKAEGAVDCWGKDTPSGSTVRRTVQGILLTGIFQ